MTASPSARPPVRPALAGAPFAIRPELLASADPVLCEVCENDLYLEVVIIRRLSALLSPSGRVEMMRFPVLACSQCGHVNTGFLPPGVTREIGAPGTPGDLGPMGNDLDQDCPHCEGPCLRHTAQGCRGPAGEPGEP